MLELGIAEWVACLSGAFLAEGIKPAETWKSSIINVLLGICGGMFGPQGLEIWIERTAKARQLTTFVCALSGATICRAFLNWIASYKFGDFIDMISRIGSAFRKPPTGGG